VVEDERHPLADCAVDFETWVAETRHPGVGVVVGVVVVNGVFFAAVGADVDLWFRY
jgi:hypothetical protein